MRPRWVAQLAWLTALLPAGLRACPASCPRRHSSSQLSLHCWAAGVCLHKRNSMESCSVAFLSLHLAALHINHLKLSSHILTLSLHACCASSLLFWHMQVVAYYIEQSKANNHAVREAACACIAELMCKASCQLPLDSRGSCILAQGVTQRLMKSRGVTNAGAWFNSNPPRSCNSTS